MTTKYERPVAQSVRWRARGTPYLRQQSMHPGLSPRARGLFLLLSTLLVLSLLTVASVTIRSQKPHEDTSVASTPMCRGEALITGKNRDAAGNPQIELQIQLDGGESVNAVTPMDEPYWHAFQPGDRVAVLYELDAENQAIHLRECGLLALPPANP